MPRKPPHRSTQPAAIRLRDRDLEAWLASQAEPGESLGQTAGRLLRDHRRLLSQDAEVAGVEAMRRRVRAAIER